MRSAPSEPKVQAALDETPDSEQAPPWKTLYVDGVSLIPTEDEDRITLTPCKESNVAGGINHVGPRLLPLSALENDDIETGLGFFDTDWQTPR